jgi:predicted kinase
VPFAVREHVVALVAHARKAVGLPASGAPAEAYMELSCSLDLRSLYHLALADARAVGEGEARLGHFREKARQLGVFGRVHPAPLDERAAEDAGLGDAGERHRSRNALRYFQLAAGMHEPAWHAERLRQEAGGPRGRLHLLVGLAGCGKSAWASEHLSETLIVSSDRMREELTGDPADQSQNYLVFQRCMDRIRESLRRGREVTFDATNLTKKLRSMPLQAARWSGAEVFSYFFDVPMAETLRRNLHRPRHVPEDVIRRGSLLLEPPALYEADHHFAVDAEGQAARYWPVVPV